MANFQVSSQTAVGSLRPTIPGVLSLKIKRTGCEAGDSKSRSCSFLAVPPHPQRLISTELFCFRPYYLRFFRGGCHTWGFRGSSWPRWGIARKPLVRLNSSQVETGGRSELKLVPPGCMTCPFICITTEQPLFLVSRKSCWTENLQASWGE